MAGEAGGVLSTRRLELVAERDDELCDALASGARAQDADGDLQASRQHFERAYRLAEQAGDVRSRALAALGLAGLWAAERRTATSAVLLEARLQHVLAPLDADSPLALRIRARLAGETDYLRGEHAAILAVLHEVRAATDPVPLAEALSLAHHCLLGPDHVRLRRDLAVELIKASFRTERRTDLLMGLLWETVDAYSEGDPHAGRLLGELRGHLGERPHLAVGFVVSAMDVMLAIRAGRLAEAESLAEICARSGAAAGDIDSQWWPGAQLVTIRWYQGRLGELLPMLRDQVQCPVLSAVDNSSVAALAVAAALGGDRHTAASSLAGLCGGDLAQLPRSSSWLVTMNGIVEAAALLGDAHVAEQAYELLRPYASLPMVGSLGITCFGTTQQALGVASLTSGHLDRAIDHLQAAVQQNLALAHWPAVIASRQRLAQALRLRGRPGDGDVARCELDSAASEGAALGLCVLSVPVLSLLPSGRPAAQDRVPGHPGPSGPVAECHRAGRKWRLTVHGRSVLVADSIGMMHLAVLIANPRQEVRAADLVAGLAGLTRASSADGPAQAVLDHEAITEYRDRLRRLDAELGQPDPGQPDPGQPDPGDDPGRMARARAERDWLIAELAAAAGLGGRTRSFPDQGERARVAVGKAIRRAIIRDTEEDTIVGGHLRQAVHTGVRCSYWPG
jgi:hypothetical protein